VEQSWSTCGGIGEHSAIGTDVLTVAMHIGRSSVVWEAQQRTDVGDEKWSR
jgi:hypothetical protein